MLARSMLVTDGQNKPFQNFTIFDGADVAAITKIYLSDAVESNAAATNYTIELMSCGMVLIDASATLAKGVESFPGFLRTRRRSKNGRMTQK
jgi:hypothetical protein